MKKQNTAFYSRPSFFIRIPLSLLLVWAVGKETGVWTAVTILLILLAIEVIGILITDIYRRIGG